MDKIIELSYELKKALSLDKRIILLDEIDKKMNENEEVMALSYKKDMAINDYEFAINHFTDGSKEVESAKKALHKAKLDLDLHPTVQEYLKAYSIVRDLYMEINEILFSILNQNFCKM